MQRHNQDQNVWAHVKGYGHKVVLHELVFMHCWSQQRNCLWRRVHTVKVWSLWFFYTTLSYSFWRISSSPRTTKIHSFGKWQALAFLRRLTKFIHQLTPGVPGIQQKSPNFSDRSCIWQGPSSVFKEPNDSSPYAGAIWQNQGRPNSSGGVTHENWQNPSRTHTKDSADSAQSVPGTGIAATLLCPTLLPLGAGPYTIICSSDSRIWKLGAWPYIKLYCLH